MNELASAGVYVDTTLARMDVDYLNCQREQDQYYCDIVEPSKNRPIFLKGQNGKEFWVRGNHGNRQLTDNEELANYCIDKWGK
jgi:hypothetical protein